MQCSIIFNVRVEYYYIYCIIAVIEQLIHGDLSFR